MGQVDIVVERVQMAEGPFHALDHHAGVRERFLGVGQGLAYRGRGLLAHVDPDDAAHLLNRVGLDPQPAADVAIRAVNGETDARAVAVEAHAVVATADRALGPHPDLAERQHRPPVWAAILQRRR